MARFVVDPNRLNNTIEAKGEEYELRLLQRSHAVFRTLLGLLPSNYRSSIEGPNYTLVLKAMAVELSRIELSLEDINSDLDFESTRSDFLYSSVGYLCFMGGRLPDTDFDDAEFRKFLLNLIKIYFKGSLPTSVRDAVALFLDTDFKVAENFLLVREGVAGLDISDQFGFQVSLELEGQFPQNLFTLQSSLKTILDLVRPAHTLYRIRYIFKDVFTPNDGAGVLDSMRWNLMSYHYDDTRSYWRGVSNVDRLGRKTNHAVSAEDHSTSF